jgi:hypothetical protein
MAIQTGQIFGTEIRMCNCSRSGLFELLRYRSFEVDFTAFG